MERISEHDVTWPGRTPVKRSLPETEEALRNLTGGDACSQCDFCKHHGLQCDAGDAACTTCAGNRITCTFTKPKKRPRTKVTSSQSIPPTLTTLSSGVTMSCQPPDVPREKASSRPGSIASPQQPAGGGTESQQAGPQSMDPPAALPKRRRSSAAKPPQPKSPGVQQQLPTGTVGLVEHRYLSTYSDQFGTFCNLYSEAEIRTALVQNLNRTQESLRAPGGDFGNAAGAQGVGMAEHCCLWAAIAVGALLDHCSLRDFERYKSRAESGLDPRLLQLGPQWLVERGQHLISCQLARACLMMATLYSFMGEEGSFHAMFALCTELMRLLQARNYPSDEEPCSRLLEVIGFHNALSQLPTPMGLRVPFNMHLNESCTTLRPRDFQKLLTEVALIFLQTSVAREVRPGGVLAKPDSVKGAGTPAPPGVLVRVYEYLGAADDILSQEGGGSREGAVVAAVLVKFWYAAFKLLMRRPEAEVLDMLEGALRLTLMAPGVIRYPPCWHACHASAVMLGWASRREAYEQFRGLLFKVRYQPMWLPPIQDIASWQPHCDQPCCDRVWEFFQAWRNPRGVCFAIDPTIPSQHPRPARARLRQAYPYSCDSVLPSRSPPVAGLPNGQAMRPLTPRRVTPNVEGRAFVVGTGSGEPLAGFPPSPSRAGHPPQTPQPHPQQPTHSHARRPSMPLPADLRPLSFSATSPPHGYPPPFEDIPQPRAALPAARTQPKAGGGQGPTRAVRRPSGNAGDLPINFSHLLPVRDSAAVANGVRRTQSLPGSSACGGYPAAPSGLPAGTPQLHMKRGVSASNGSSASMPRGPQMHFGLSGSLGPAGWGGAGPDPPWPAQGPGPDSGLTFHRGRAGGASPTLNGHGPAGFLDLGLLGELGEMAPDPPWLGPGPNTSPAFRRGLAGGAPLTVNGHGPTVSPEHKLLGGFARMSPDPPWPGPSPDGSPAFAGALAGGVLPILNGHGQTSSPNHKLLGGFGGMTPDPPWPGQSLNGGRTFAEGLAGGSPQQPSRHDPPLFPDHGLLFKSFPGADVDLQMSLDTIPDIPVEMITPETSTDSLQPGRASDSFMIDTLLLEPRGGMFGLPDFTDEELDSLAAL